MFHSVVPSDMTFMRDLSSTVGPSNWLWRYEADSRRAQVDHPLPSFRV